MGKRILGLWTVVVALALSAACTVHQADEAPALTGPSEFGLAVTMTAKPDRVTIDGRSTSTITVQVRGPNGEAKPKVALRVDMIVDCRPLLRQGFKDCGTLNAQNIETDADGRASVTYTAPAPPPPPGENNTEQTVSIRATAVGADAQAAIQRTVDIRLVPPGVILPPADTPTAAFTVTPTPVNVNVAATFDASGSCPGQASSTGACLASTSVAIDSYAWNFGDGSTPTSGKTVTHTFTALGTFTFSVTLTVTNDRGVRASKTQDVQVVLSVKPTAVIVPASVTVPLGGRVFFDGGQSFAATGHSIVSHVWRFLDDGTTKTGVTTSHDYGNVGTYSVTLTVTDDTGQSGFATGTVTVNP